MIERETTPVAKPYDDYAQSANALFHFVTKKEYLDSILKKRTIIPRYCKENIEYLNLKAGETTYREIAVLQKCFCDIPFHKLMDISPLHLVDANGLALSEIERFEIEKKNTHPDCYGRFAIALSKSWGESHGLQPIQYINGDSTYAADFTALFSSVLEEESIPDICSSDILRRLAYMKPLRGVMERKIDGRPIYVQKNFHDEKEWRYVPDAESLATVHMECVIANPYILKVGPFIDRINKGISHQQYRQIWIDYTYNDVRYIIVPDSQARLDIISTILDIPDELFDSPDNVQYERYILMSKILVLDEIKKDW